LAAVASGNEIPDSIVQDVNTVRQRSEANQGTYSPEYLDQDVVSTSDSCYALRCDSVGRDDEAYGLPLDTDTHALFNNKDLFEEAGLDPDTPPAPWDELEEMARQLDVEDGASFEQFGFYPLWNLGLDVWTINTDEGTSWFDEND